MPGGVEGCQVGVVTEGRCGDNETCHLAVQGRAITRASGRAKFCAVE